MNYQQKIRAIVPNTTIGYKPNSSLMAIKKCARSIGSDIDIVGTSLYLVTPAKKYVRLVSSDDINNK